MAETSSIGQVHTFIAKKTDIFKTGGNYEVSRLHAQHRPFHTTAM